MNKYIDPPEGWTRCRSCGRYRERGLPCRRCEEPALPACECEPVRWSHRHLLHALLELRYQFGLEAADPWLERLLAEAWWNHDEGELPAREDWRAQPRWAPRLEAFPALGAFLGAPDPVKAVFDWAGVTDAEGDVYMSYANGYTMAAIARKEGIRLVTAEARFANAQARIRLALEFSIREEPLRAGRAERRGSRARAALGA